MVVTESNPAVMLIKELVELAQFSDDKVNFPLSALGYYIKIPTRQLFHEIVVS